MINMEKLLKVVDAMNALPDMSVTLTLESSGAMNVSCWVKEYWSGAVLTEERRHEVLAILTPLVGKMEKEVNGTAIGYAGARDDLRINLNRIDKCTIVGYKKVTKRVPKMETRVVKEEKEVETGEFEEEEELKPITDCEIRMGKASESDIEVPA